VTSRLRKVNVASNTTTCGRPHVTPPIFLPGLEPRVEFLEKLLIKFPIPNSTEIRPVDADRLTDMTKLTGGAGEHVSALNNSNSFQTYMELQ